jgi:hypothetical protein
MKKLYLHIGTEKTGTTSLQYFLAENRERLAAKGCWVPGCVSSPNHSLLAVCCYDEFRNDDLCRYFGIRTPEEWEQMKSKIRDELTNELGLSGCKIGIVSTEHIQSRLFTVSERNRLRALLKNIGFDDVSVILYLRDPASLANSHYFTDVAQGYLGWLPGKPDEHYFKNLCDHRTTIQEWQNVYGKDRLIIRLYDADGRGKFSTIDDFLGLITELNGQKLKPVKNGNVSISALGVELIRRINEIEPFWVNGTVNPVRRGLNHHIRKHYRGASYGMPEWLAQEYDMAFAESNEWVRQNFFPDRDTLFVRKKIRESVLEMSESDLQRETMKLVGMLRRRYCRRLWRREVSSRLRSHLANFLKGTGCPKP